MVRLLDRGKPLPCILCPLQGHGGCARLRGMGDVHAFGALGMCPPSGALGMCPPSGALGMCPPSGALGYNKGVPILTHPLDYRSIDTLLHRYGDVASGSARKET